MPALWAPHGVGPRDEELFVGDTRNIVNRNAFDPSVLRERGPWNSIPCVVVDGKLVRVEDSPRPQPPQSGASSSSSSSYDRRLTPRARRRQAEVAQLQSGLDEIRQRLNRAS